LPDDASHCPRPYEDAAHPPWVTPGWFVPAESRMGGGRLLPRYLRATPDL